MIDQYWSTGRLNVGEVGRILKNGIPSNEYVICCEIKNDQCNDCYFNNRCRTTHNVCRSDERDDKKMIIFRPCKKPE